MGVLDEGFASLAEDRERFDGEPVTYTIGETGATILIGTVDEATGVVTGGAVRGRSSHERFAIADGRVAFEEVPQDWLIRPERLEGHTPTRGDRIEDAAGYVYEATPRSDEPAVRWVDRRQMWRIRTVLKGVGV